MNNMEPKAISTYNYIGLAAAFVYKAQDFIYYWVELEEGGARRTPDVALDIIDRKFFEIRDCVSAITDNAERAGDMKSGDELHYVTLPAGYYKFVGCGRSAGVFTELVHPNVQAVRCYLLIVDVLDAIELLGYATKAARARNDELMALRKA